MLIRRYVIQSHTRADSCPEFLAASSESRMMALKPGSDAPLPLPSRTDPAPTLPLAFDFAEFRRAFVLGRIEADFCKHIFV